MIKRLGTPNMVLLLLSVMYFLTYIDRVNIGTAANQIKGEFGLSNRDLGWIFSAFAYPYAIFQVFGGWIGDRFGPRKVLVVCGTIWAGATMLTGLATSMTTLFLFRLALGFGEGATFPTASRALQSWVPTAKRAYAQGLTHSFSRLGNAVAPPIVAALTVTYGWRGAFVALGMVSLIWVIVWFWYFRDNPRDHRGVTEADLAQLPRHIDKETMAKRRIPWRRLVLRMAPVTLTYFCYGWSLWLYLNWLPSFFLQGYGLDIKQSALFSAGAFFAGVVGDTLGGVVSDRILKRTGNVQLARLSVILFGMVGGAICLSLVFTTKDLDTIALLVSAGFFFLELIVGPIWSIPMDIAPQYVGTATGLMNIGSATAAIVSPLAFGYIVDLTGNWVLPFAGSIGMLLVGMVLCFTMRPDRPFVAEPASA